MGWRCCKGTLIFPRFYAHLFITCIRNFTTYYSTLLAHVMSITNQNAAFCAALGMDESTESCFLLLVDTVLPIECCWRTVSKFMPEQFMSTFVVLNH